MVLVYCKQDSLQYFVKVSLYQKTVLGCFWLNSMKESEWHSESLISNLPFTVTLGKTFHFLGSHFTHTQCRNCTKWLQKALSIPCESIQHFLSNLKSCDILKGNVPWTLCGFLESWGCHKGGVICISEVIEISPINHDSSLCFL